MLKNETEINIYLQLFRERLRNLRGEKSLQEVAKDIEISRATLGYYESGDRKPDIEILLKIAKYYNVSCDYLLGLTATDCTDIDTRIISEKTGLLPQTIAWLYDLSQSSEKHNDYLKLETVNFILSDNVDIIGILTQYLFMNIDNVRILSDAEDNNSGYKSVGKNKIELENIGFMDEKHNYVIVYNSSNYVLYALLTDLQQELIQLRKAIQKNISDNHDKN